MGKRVNVTPLDSLMWGGNAQETDIILKTPFIDEFTEVFKRQNSYIAMKNSFIH